jgi:predicted nucleic acid-binding protein
MVDVVFDASALILTAKIGLLKELSQRLDIHTTETVYEETTRAETYDAQLIQQRSEDNIFTSEKVPEEHIGKILDKFNLDKGEASTIALQRQINADIIATDDKQAINTCKILEIKFTTSLKLLGRAYEKELISKEKALTKLKELDKNGWYKDDQVKTIEQKIRGENQE